MFRTCLYTEELLPPFDEGIKNFTRHLFQEAPLERKVLRLGAGDPALVDRQIQVSKSLTTSDLRRAIRDFAPDAVVYIPISSVTPASFLRARILKLHARGVPVAMIGVQPRRYPRLLRMTLEAAAPDIIYVQSEGSRKTLAAAGFSTGVIHAGVDANKFRPVDASEKARLRRDYGIDADAYVVVHVGHISELRNLGVMADIARLPGTQAVVVASSSTSTDQALASCLKERDVCILDRFIERIEEIYQLADLYVFPVTEQRGAIELPLSVLEAMACNLPVVTTRFGGLVDCLQEGDGLYYAGDSEQILENVELARRTPEVATRGKIEPFTWRAVTERLMSEVEQLVKRSPSR